MKLSVIADENIPYLRHRLEDVAEVRYVNQEGFTPSVVKNADALLIRTRTRVDENLIRDSKIKLVATATIGTDHIDIPACSGAGITVSSAPGCNAPAVAQYVWAALLNLGFMPEKGMKLGIIGCGHIGSIVKEWGEALGAKIMVCDPPLERTIKQGETSGKLQTHNLKTFHTLEEVMKNCDAITIHTPLTRTGEDATYHLIGERELSLMGNDTILVNASRGEMVDTDALIKRLNQGGLRVALDVWEKEPAINKDLLGLVDIGTCHIAGYSRQGKERATRMVLESIERQFGVKTDTEGLEGPYIPVEAPLIIGNNITHSYDIKADSDRLKKNPDGFESLRHNYNYREEYLPTESTQL